MILNDRHYNPISNKILQKFNPATETGAFFMQQTDRFLLQPEAPKKIELVPEPIFCMSCVAYTVEKKNQICVSCEEKLKNFSLRPGWWVLGTALVCVAVLAAVLLMIAVFVFRPGK